MLLAAYYFADPRLVLLPIEQLTPAGLTPAFADLLRARDWDDTRIAFFNAAFTRYWTRSSALAARIRTWPPPRLRHVALVGDSLSVRPYAQLLNVSAWTLYASDFDPQVSDPEFAAYLFVHGDRMALTGEVTMAALHSAAYWFERTDAECAAFAAAAARAPRPDADAFRALAAALPWLRQLYHEPLRPPPAASTVRSIMGSGVLVPQAIEGLPPALVQRWTEVAQKTLAAFHARWRAPDRQAVAQLCDWLAEAAPPLLITGQNGRIIWDPDTPDRLGSVRTVLRTASGAAVQDIDADLHVVDRHTRRFLGALVDPEALPTLHPNTEQRGYSYLHRTRRLIAYNLYEPGIERLQGPALPYARAMLGARTVHEWAHLAVDAGWVPQTASPARVADLIQALSDQLAMIIAAAPETIRRQTAADLAALAGEEKPGRDAAPVAARALVRILVTRLPDYQANLLSQRFLNEAERETYIRQNIRPLRAAYPPEQLWRMLARYLAEYAYLGFSAVPDPASYFRCSTWFENEFVAPGILDARRFDALTAAVRELCTTYTVDDTRFRAV